jgi:RNA polymerase sigma factor (sigma-70 family)
MQFHRELRELDSTRWSVVLEAGNRESDTTNESLEILCREYWYPLYSYVRRRVSTVDEAQDLTQEFFARLLEKGYLAKAQPERGRFRAFLLASFKHFLSNEWDKRRAQKRGGGRKKLSLDLEAGEARYQLEPVDTLTPERLYERLWVVGLLSRVLSLLRDECQAEGKAGLFNVLKPYLTGRPRQASYAETADQLGMSEGATRVAVHRLRRRYGDLLRAEIAETVAGPEEVQEEIQSLFAAFDQ